MHQTSLPFSPAFYRVAALASLLSAITTLGLIYLPEFWAPGTGFEARMARVADPAYQLRAHVYLLHPFLTFTAALAVASALYARRQPALAVCGLLGFGVWATTEAGQQTWTLFAFDRWRLAYLAGDATVREQMALLTRLHDGVWDAMYVLILIAFAIGNGLYAAALLRARGFDRWLGGFYLAACALTLSLLVVEFGGPALPSPLADWSYPAIQPLGRTLIAVWLWRLSRRTEAA